MNNGFSTIGLGGKQGDPRVRDTLIRLADFAEGRGHPVMIERGVLEPRDESGRRVAPLEEVARHADLAISVGGDGTLLHAARTMAPRGVPLVGINLGRLGFLADIPSNRMIEALEQILRGEYQEEERFLLRVDIGPGEAVHTSATALNDVVVHKWNVARLIELELFIGGRFVEAQRSDGIIVSTPTGSTGYALSGGGPLLMPSLDALVLVPVCPHRLGNRPMVVDGGSTVEILVCGQTESAHVRVTCDGQTILSVAPDDRIRIRKADRGIRLIHPRDHDHFNILRAKLGWGEHPR
ncbi:MAG: NAD(+) kinase [Chromatiales bacterium]|jgi:NAD+ kinase